MGLLSPICAPAAAPTALQPSASPKPKPPTLTCPDWLPTKAGTQTLPLARFQVLYHQEWRDRHRAVTFLCGSLVSLGL